LELQRRVKRERRGGGKSGRGSRKKYNSGKNPRETLKGEIGLTGGHRRDQGGEEVGGFGCGKKRFFGK